MCVAAQSPLASGDISGTFRGKVLNLQPPGGFHNETYTSVCVLLILSLFLAFPLSAFPIQQRNQPATNSEAVTSVGDCETKERLASSPA